MDKSDKKKTHGKNQDKQRIAFAMSMLGESRFKIILSVVLILLTSSVTPVIQPVSYKLIFDAFEKADRASLMAAAFFCFFLTLVNALMIYVMLVYLDTWADLIVEEQKMGLIKKLIRKPFGTLHVRYENGDMVNRVMELSNSFFQMFFIPVRFFSRIIVCVFLAVEFIGFGWYFTLIVFCVFLLLAGMSVFCAKWKAKLNEQMQITYGERENLLRTIVKNDDFYRSSFTEDIIIGKFRKNREKQFAIGFWQTVADALEGAVSAFIMLAGKLAIILAAVPMKLAGRLTAGVLSACFLAFEVTVEQLKRIKAAVTGYPAVFVPLKRFMEIQSIEEKRPKTCASKAVIELRNVSLAYGEKKILQNVDFSVSRGEHVAIVGENGSGKTTLLRALTGMFEGLHSGAAEWESGISESSSITYIPVDTQLFYDTVQNNVQMIFQSQAAEELPESMTREYALIAQKNKDEISEGQRQITNVIRAWNRKGILIGDEITGSLAPELREKVIKELLERYETAVLVVHDRALLPYFDRVIMVKDGKCKEEICT